jgi:DNA-binding FadR family transcriptional regulator
MSVNSKGVKHSQGRDRASLGSRILALSAKRPLKRSEIIARDLVEHIVDAGLPAGAMLPREQEMIDQLGVGRTTIREALRILETRGVISVRSGRDGGPVVRHPQPSDLTDSLTLILQFQRATMVEVHDARVWLEPLAARMAAEQITRSEITRLREINEEMSAGVDASDVGRIADANQRFHQVIAQAAGNIVVQVFTETLLTVSESGVSEIYDTPKLKRAAVDAHEGIIEALEARDPDRVEAAMRDHILVGKSERVKGNRSVMSRPLRWVQ